MLILAIDDNLDNLTILQAILSDRIPEARFLSAQNGPEGIQMARSQNPDIILLDIVMPGMDGFAVCRKLKEDPNLQSIPVLFLSALRTDRESRIRALESGADGFLSKPFDEVELSLQIRAMAKIKAANSMLRMEKTQLAALVAEHTHELELELAERERAERLTEVLYGISQAIYSTVKLDDLFQRIHFLLSNIAPANNFFIALLRSDERFLSFPYNHDEKDTGDWPDIETDDPQSLTVEVLTTKRPLLLDEARLQDRYATGRNKVWGTAPRCWLGVPLIFKDNAIGVMAVQDYQNGFAYSQKDVTLLESVAGQIASAIEHKRAEAAILQAGNDWENTFNAVTDMITVHDRDFNILRANAAAKKILGISPQWKIPTKCYRNYHGKERPSEECPSCQCLLSGESCTIEIYEPHLDKYLEVRVMPRFEKDGSTVGLIHVVRDITERKRTEEEKIKMEAQLRQALKMESVGRLAGGVAHDFNNMLGVILGHVEIALDQVQPAQPLYADLTEIRLATERSADLTRQLLAFARKQNIAPKVLELNETIGSMLKMLQRLIGEDIQLRWHPGAGLWPVKIDPSQVDQILANLCVNARDAITDVGMITIETGNRLLDAAFCANRLSFVPGEYVMLAVSDSGCGMDAETLNHIFEPFFTTKGMGKGTGLGLATVYGIVKQNIGFIDVFSQPGQGTTLTIYLPRYLGTGVPLWTPGVQGSVPGGHETVLLVEDEPTMLKPLSMMLERQGYTVLAANAPGEALRLAQSHVGKIHLLITDVVMPEMNGRDLAHKLLSLNPHLRCLFISGYTTDLIAHHGVLDQEVHFLQKPFSMQVLASKVRELLDGVK